MIDRVCWTLVAAVMLVAAHVGLAGPAEAQEHRCRIGRPAYCEKYGHDLCQAGNPKGAEACERWRQACLRCHEPISACLGDAPVSAASPRCTTCSARWSRCMRAIDARHWPNRLSR